MHYWIGGDPEGTPILLWHGFLGTGYTWRRVAPDLASRGFSVLVPDMRGFGDSDKPDGVLGYDARALAEEMRGLAKEIGFGGGRQLLLAGHDLGAWPALIWAADHPGEVAGLLYVESPIMLGDLIRPTMAYTPDGMGRMAKWWWIVPLAPGVPEQLVVGNERVFLKLFLHRTPHQAVVFSEDVMEKYLRTFAGHDGVLGSMGMYPAAFATLAQTDALTANRIITPIVGMMSKGREDQLQLALPLIATDWRVVGVADCGHFIPEERPAAVVTAIEELVARRP